MSLTLMFLAFRGVGDWRGGVVTTLLSLSLVFQVSHT